jgi:hypothetical protein
MDGGIGEAALLGAVIGGGSSAITGGDPLKGALMGGLTSGVMGGFGGLSGVEGLGQSGTDAFTASQTATGNALGTAEGLPYNAGAGYGSALSTPVGAGAVDTEAFMEPGINAGTNTVVPNTPVPPNTQLHGLDLIKANPWTYGGIAASQALPGLLQPRTLGSVAGTEKYEGPLSKFKYSADRYAPDVVVPPSPAYKPVYTDYRMAEGGIATLADGGSLQKDPVNVDFMGKDMYPMSQQQTASYATPSQMPTSAQQTMASYEPATNPLTGEPTAHMAKGGIADLGGYSDGGRMLKGPGDGMSDSIPASIGGKQPARLADGEFVVPADVVSHLGNGSTDAGAKQLYSMMDKVRKARTGNKKQGKQINPKKFMPV